MLGKQDSARREGLEDLAQRRFDVELYRRAAKDSELPGWVWKLRVSSEDGFFEGPETIEAICGSDELPRSMVQELELNPRGLQQLFKHLVGCEAFGACP